MSILTTEKLFTLLVFGFDIGEPAGVNIRYTHCICYNSNEFDKMIPLRDTVPTKNYPVVNNTIIGINVVIFLYQVIRPVGSGPDLHLYGTIAITPHEALTGTRKLVNIPWGFHKRLYKVVVPAGIQEGRKLRLKGLGKQATAGQRGDLFLKVLIR
jgi:hypothetical protein